MICIIFKYIFNNVIVQVIVLVWPSSHGTSAMASSLLRWSRNSTSSWRACAATGHVDHFLSLPNFLGISMDFTRSFANWSQLTREQVLKVGAPGQMHQPASLLLLWYLCSKWTLFFQRRAGATLFVTAKENDRSASACSPPEAADQWRETSSKRL